MCAWARIETWQNTCQGGGGKEKGGNWYREDFFSPQVPSTTVNAVSTKMNC